MEDSLKEYRNHMLARIRYELFRIRDVSRCSFDYLYQHGLTIEIPPALFESLCCFLRFDVSDGILTLLDFPVDVNNLLETNQFRIAYSVMVSLDTDQEKEEEA